MNNPITAWLRRRRLRAVMSTPTQSPQASAIDFNLLRDVGKIAIEHRLDHHERRALIRYAAKLDATGMERSALLAECTTTARQIKESRRQVRAG